MASANNGPHEAESREQQMECGARDESHNPQSLQIFQSGHTKKFLREVVSIGASLFNLIH